jgi:hypothetical protein
MKAVLVLLGLAAAAHAGPRKVLVMRAESSTDWGTRSEVERVVVGLARNVDRGAGQSETSFKDLAAMMGCTGGLETCKAAVIDALVVDELVDISIAPAGGADVKVTVRRASKTAGTRSASATVPKANPDKPLTAAVGPLFGATRTIDAPVAKQPPPRNQGTVVAGGGGVVIDNEDPLASRDARRRPPVEEPPPPLVEPPPPAEPPKTVAAVEPAASERADDPRPRSRRGALYVAGMATGVVVATIGVLAWQQAGQLEDDAAAAPTRTLDDVRALRDLESRGDRYALWGNVAFVGGLAIAGASGYLWWRHRRSTRVAIAPVLLDRGGGIAVRIGAP